MTCGEETEAECLRAIEPFREKITFYEVRDITPQVVALNKMLEKCKTEYLIPLDSDIVLNDDAYERITQAIGKHNNWHSILFPLWDTFTEERILALKILNMEYMCPFEDVKTPDTIHYSKLEATGAKCIHDYLKEPIGKHVVRGKHFCYHKYFDVYQTLRANRRIWDKGAFKNNPRTIREAALNHHNHFVQKYNSTRNEDYLAAIAGMFEGLKRPLDNKSKDLSISVDYDIIGVSGKFVSWLLSADFPKEYMEKL